MNDLSDSDRLTGKAATFEADYQAIIGQAPQDFREELFAVIRMHAQSLTDHFYEAMLADPGASPYLSHELVNGRLRRSMVSWLQELFDPSSAPSQISLAQQRSGEVHARVGLSPRLVRRAVRALLDACPQLIERHFPNPNQAVRAMGMIYQIVHLAVDEMNSISEAATTRLARSEESYRLMHIWQDITAERERRRAELMEWSQELLAMLFQSGAPNEVARDNGSHPFLLWLRHKAGLLFGEAPELTSIRQAVGTIEAEILPELARSRQNPLRATQAISALHTAIGRIKALMLALFDQSTVPQDGRDTVTGLLSRRYFSTIAKREIELSSERATDFSILLIDIDNFRSVLTKLGYDGSSLILAQFATLMHENVRAGDFTFRVGDDEFLILLVETDREAAMTVAEGLRKRVAQHAFRADAVGSLSLTISIGVCHWDRHPDFQRLLDRADLALRHAKRLGKDRCSADPGP